MASEFRYEPVTAREVEMVRALQELQGTIHFVIDRLGKSQVPENTVSETCRLMMPSWFVQEHGDKLQEVIVLRSTSSSIPCRVRLRIYNTPPKPPAIKFGKGWRDFATCNGLVVGDSLIFELRGLSQFEVYVFRGTGLPAEIITSSLQKYCSTESEISQEINGHCRISIGTGNDRLPRLLQGGSSEGSEEIDLCEAVARKRKSRPEEDGGSVSRQNPSSFIKMRLSELEDVQVSQTERRHSQQPPVVHQLFGMPLNSSRNGQEPRMFSENLSAQKYEHCALRNGDIKLEMNRQPAKLSLPSFIRKLAEHNVHDSAGNTSGAHLTVPLSFVKTHGIRLQAHVKLQGTREASPSRMVTCSYDMALQDGEGARWPPLSLGWGDFVRDNALHAGQELVFTLASESSFVVREEEAMALAMNDLDAVLATLSGQKSAYFLIMALTPCQAPAAMTRNCKLMLPAWFVHQHEDKLKLQDFVVLRSASTCVAPCTVRLKATRATVLRSSETYFGKGWKAFARNNELAIGDSLIFHLRGTSEFNVHIFRGTRAISSSHAPTKRSSDSELSRRNAQNDSSAGCSDGSQPGEDHLCEAIAKKRKVAGSEDAGAVCTPTENPYLLNLRLSELDHEDVQVSSFQSKPQMPKTTYCGAQNCRRSVHVKDELQPPGASLPSFIQRLVKFNVQDFAGNTSGARFDVPFSFVKTHNVQLQPHVKLQGPREESPVRVVTCCYNMLQDSTERSGRPPLSLGWGDFVRENTLHEGQRLVFTLVSESFFVIKEVHEIVVYTK